MKVESRFGGGVCQKCFKIVTLFCCMCGWTVHAAITITILKKKKLSKLSPHSEHMLMCFKWTECPQNHLTIYSLWTWTSLAALWMGLKVKALCLTMTSHAVNICGLSYRPWGNYISWPSEVTFLGQCETLWVRMYASLLSEGDLWNCLIG